LKIVVFFTAVEDAEDVLRFGNNQWLVNRFVKVPESGNTLVVADGDDARPAVLDITPAGVMLEMVVRG